MTNSPTELDTLLIESLQHLTEHLDAQTTRQAEQTQLIDALQQDVVHLQQQVTALAARLPA
jgi:uncharacterized protein YlxW (UPF0749 family)